ncbi:hypothetical protein BDV25DRAFT_52436 [Aspergillus avenaceus]|uniref:Zn(2)-C6 fungal-type domain-containing protein n=1 Tax=Aspergillus avenaceus TaxID=36643 RepID=A0A5N6TIY0_ASPAV|nr:hypothetical protein BDV25DRAFT_52436 [Aspergillus avenaceus]
MLTAFRVNSHLTTQNNKLSGFPQRRRDGCSECRRKKVKCDLRKPVCSRCTHYPRECKYDLSFIQSQHPGRPRVVERRHEGSCAGPASKALTTIPRIDPLYQPDLVPSPLLTTEESRFLLRLFATETAPLLLPAAPQAFVSELISHALNTSHLLHALLAAACSHHGRLVGDITARSRTTILKYTNSAISGLRTALCETARSLNVKTALTALVLCTNDICNGTKDIWKAHLLGAMRLLVGFLDHQTNGSIVTDPFALCLVKWFATLDTMANLSGIYTNADDRDHYWYLDRIPNVHSGYVDDISGYSPELIPILARLGQLSKWQIAYASLNQGTPVVYPLNLLEEAQSLESTILSLADRTVSDTTRMNHGCQAANDLQATHRAFVHATLLYLHRRVLLLPRSHPKVRTDVANVINSAQDIDSFSSANILILWPMFSAGCETDNVSERDIIQSRMAKMQSLGLGNYTRAKDLLKAFWSSGSSLPWDLYFTGLGLQLVLF